MSTNKQIAAELREGYDALENEIAEAKARATAIASSFADYFVTFSINHGLGEDADQINEIAAEAFPDKNNRRNEAEIFMLTACFYDEAIGTWDKLTKNGGQGVHRTTWLRKVLGKHKSSYDFDVALATQLFKDDAAKAAKKQKEKDKAKKDRENGVVYLDVEVGKFLALMNEVQPEGWDEISEAVTSNLNWLVGGEE